MPTLRHVICLSPSISATLERNGFGSPQSSASMRLISSMVRMASR